MPQQINKTPPDAEQSPKPINHFTALKELNYQIDEVTDIKNLYANSAINHPIAEAIKGLLLATERFLRATTLEPEFKNKRDASLSDGARCKKVASMASAISEIAKLAAHQSDPDNIKLLNSAREYSINCVQSRINALQQASDRYIAICKDRENGLEKYITLEESPRSKIT